MILETTFLIDLEREAIRGESGPAHRFLETLGREPLFITFTIAGELACGPRISRRNAWEELVSPFRILPHSLDVSWEYGRIYRFLSGNGMLIGANDLWIAATALAHGQAVATRNLEHYRRVPDLEVETY